MAEPQLKLHECAVTDALDSMEEAVVVYDADGCLVTCNRSFLEMYNYSVDQARPGVHFRELGEIDIRHGNVAIEDEKGHDYLERKAEYRRTLKGSFTVKLLDGRWIRRTDRAMPGGGFVSVHVDVTQLKEAQEEMLAAQRIAEKHEKQLEQLNETLEDQVIERTQELEVAISAAKQQARTDPLTGLKNRRAFYENANSIHEAAKRYGNSYAAIMIDIDNFKSINDSQGHLVGDQVIKQIAEIIGEEIRVVDIAGRLGGDEFAILVPETSIQDATTLADRLLTKFTALSASDGDRELSVSASIGLANYSPADSDLESTLLRADQALYEAKATGRNRLVVSQFSNWRQDPQ